MFKVLLCDHECKYGPASNDLAMRYLRQNRYKSDKCLREDNDRDVPAVIEGKKIHRCASRVYVNGKLTLHRCLEGSTTKNGRCPIHIAVRKDQSNDCFCKKWVSDVHINSLVLTKPRISATKKKRKVTFSEPEKDSSTGDEFGSCFEITPTKTGSDDADILLQAEAKAGTEKSWRKVPDEVLPLSQKLFDSYRKQFNAIINPDSPQIKNLVDHISLVSVETDLFGVVSLQRK